MDFFAVFLIAIAGVCYAQEHVPLQVTFDSTETKQVTVDNHLKFVCSINRNLLVIVNNYVEIVRVSAVDSSEVILTQGARKVGAEPAYYNVSVDQISSDKTNVEFDILKVRDLDEGKLICRVRPFDEAAAGSAEDSVDIVVLRPLDALYLQFSDFEAITTTMTDPIELESGTYNVKCIAEGSNPAPTEVHLYLHGSKVNIIDSKTDKLEGEVIKYKTTITGVVRLSVSNSMQEFECTATSQLGDDHSVKLPIKIKVYDPKIICNDSEAYEGKVYPVLSCIVEYAGLDIKGFKYELGDKEAVEEGTQNKDFVEVKREQLSDSRAKVLLNLYKAKGWHFKTHFYLVVEHRDGHVTRESVRLHQIPGRGASKDPGNSSNLLAASAVTLIMSMWSAIMMSL